jgi:hypothetical protein
MGLAASQARFLGLTARKSNTEYEGQQVNQQRTTLANESASLYSQLTNLTVPTPPDVNDYYQTTYSFTVDNTTYTMSSLPQMDANGNTFIQSTYNYTDSRYEKVTSLAGLDVETGVGKENGVTVGGQDSFIPLENATQATFISNSTGTFYRVGDGQDATYYQLKTTEKTGNANFYDVQFNYDSTGSYQSASFTDENGQAHSGVTITSSQEANDTLYEQAMNEYNIEYSNYEKTMAQINAKTEVLQQQDKTLELRLNQLDTEQNAISTEMDAVQKVIEKNVESTFKTFA